MGKPNKFQKKNGKAGFTKNIQAKSTPPEKKDWNKFKKEKKELKKARKATKCSFEGIHEAKQIYEKLKWYVWC